VPAFPGATYILSAFGEREHFQAKACSLPPFPTIKIFIILISFIFVP
jgi:hypothetical protein